MTLRDLRSHGMLLLALTLLHIACVSPIGDQDSVTSVDADSASKSDQLDAAADVDDDTLSPTDLVDVTLSDINGADISNSDSDMPSCGADNYCDPGCPSDPDCTQNCAADNFCNTLCGESDPDCPHTCALDSVCEPAEKCLNAPDPDCGCACNFNPGICEPKASGSTDPCPCDPDCLPDKLPCQLDCHCDGWCPKPNGTSVDPDCSAAKCDFNDKICEPTAKDSTTPCPYDCDCLGGKQPCAQDGHCDSWCPKPNGTSVDPDCSS